MNPVRGRPSKIDSSLIVDAILKRKESLILTDGNVVSKLSAVWREIANSLDNKISCASLYTFVTCNRYDVRSKLSAECYSEDNHVLSHNSSADNSDSSVYNTSSLENTVSANVTNFTIPIEKIKFTNLIVDRVYRRTDKKMGKTYQRQCKRLRPGEWQEALTERIWNVTRLKCGFNFQNHHISQDATSGSINGICNCGSTIRCDIEEVEPESEHVNLKCSLTKGTGKCGKRYLRAPSRQIIGKELCQKSADVYRSEKADELMLPGDPEPPHLYSAGVLNTAKYEYESSQYLDRDPVKALAIMKTNSFGRHALHNLGYDPFYVHYWTNHQNHVYKTYASTEPACVCIDATGSIVKKIEKPDNTLSKHIFLYQCVVNCKAGQFSVTQMITESHHVNSIAFWLMEWIRSGVPYPKEVVCDSSKALLNAVVRVFTGHPTIYNYAGACKSQILPKCFIRIDVAHFIKKYASFLKGVTRLVRTFYLAAIGKLIMSTDIDSAEVIIEAILSVARSEIDGDSLGDRISICKTGIEKLNELLTGISETHSNDKDDDVIELPEDDDELIDNWWCQWGTRIDNRVKSLISQEQGDQPNAYFLPRFADYLMKDIPFIPMWSNICTNAFGYGRVPASSAAVEGEFNKLKTHLLKNTPARLRADSFVEKHLKYLNGRMKIVDANSKSCNNAQSIEDPNIDMDHEDTRAGLSSFSPSPPCDEIVEQSSCPPSEVLYPAKSTSCPACINNDAPSGAHVCALCEQPVHALEQCSVPFDADTEGYGQRRICIACQNTQNLPEIMASRETEDWRGLNKPVKRKRKTRYLGNNAQEMSELLTCTKHRKLPILKSGGHMALQPIRIDSKNVSLIRTCAFDSLFQIMLAAACDWPTLKNKMAEAKSENPLFNMAIDVLERGLRTQSYRLRAELLLKTIHGQADDQTDGGCLLINCETVVGPLARIIFKDTPSVEETSECDAGCPPRAKLLSCPSLNQAVLLDQKFHQVIENHIMLGEPGTCCICNSSERFTLSALGTYVLFDVYSDGKDEPIELQKIPKKFRNPLTNGDFHLIGIVDFKGPQIRTRLSGEIGHYTAMCLRRGNKWVEYNDQNDSDRELLGTHQAVPKLIVYASL